MTKLKKLPTVTGPQPVQVDGMRFGVPRGSRVVHVHGERVAYVRIPGEGRRIIALTGAGEVSVPEETQKLIERRFFSGPRIMNPGTPASADKEMVWVYPARSRTVDIVKDGHAVRYVETPDGTVHSFFGGVKVEVPETIAPRIKAKYFT